MADESFVSRVSTYLTGVYWWISRYSNPFQRSPNDDTITKGHNDIGDTEKDCPVCQDLYKDPKLLPCGHLLCRNCLVSWLGSNSSSQCPLCRRQIVNPQDREASSGDEIADALPTELAMAAIVESAELLSKSCVCRAHSDVTAVFMCLQCDDMLCKTCVDVHGKLSSTRHHKVTSVTSLTPECLAANLPVRCSSHPNEPSKYFCSTHSIPICQLCIVDVHSECAILTNIQRKIEEKQSALLELEDRLHAVDIHLVQAMDQMETHLWCSDARKQAIFTKIDASCDRLQRSLKECRRSLKGRVQESVHQVKMSVQEIKTDIGCKRARVASHQQIIKRVLPGAMIFDMADVLKQRVDDISKDTAVSEIPTTVEVDFHPKELDRLEKEIRSLEKLTPERTAESLLSQVFLRFHGNHGRNVQLSNDRQTASKIYITDSDTLVLSSEAIKLNSLNEVLVEKTDSGFASPVVGVIWQNPQTLNVVPTSLSELPCSAIITENCIMLYGKKVKRSHGQVLRKTTVGSRIGVLVDSDASLHLYFDDTDQGVVVRNTQQPCWAVFSIGMATQITGLRLRAK